MGRNTLYRTVTVDCGRRRVDVALPAAIPVADLLPALLRLLVTSESADPGGRWELAPIGRPALGAADTLERAGILPGEVLLLGQADEAAEPPAAALRDRLEEAVERMDRAWTARTSTAFLYWMAAVISCALVLPASRLTGGPVIAIDLTIGAVLAAAAVAAAGQAETAGAAACLVAGCGWAGLAGWTASSAAGPTAAIAGATVAALLLALTALFGFPGAAVHCAAAGVLALAAGLTAVAFSVGGTLTEVTVGLPVVAVLLIGAAPRMVLASTGLSPSGPAGADARPIDARFARADRLLTGTLIGLSAVAVFAAAPAALADDRWNRLFAVGVGALLLLRSRVFSQIPHLLAVRVPAVALLCAVGVGWYLADPGIVALLLLSVVAVAVFAAALGTTSTAVVGRARTARALDLGEQVLVVSLILLATGLLGMFDRVAAAVS